MLDSLVRVSRRVGQATDRFATDAESTARHPHDERSRLEGTGDSPPSSNDRSRTRHAADREGLPRSASGPTQSGPITPKPKSRSPFPNASDRRQTGRGAPRAESAPAATRTIERRPPFDVPPPDRRAADELNPTRGLCGPLRLPLDGFTYY